MVSKMGSVVEHINKQDPNVSYLFFPYVNGNLYSLHRSGLVCVPGVAGLRDHCTTSTSPHQTRKLKSVKAHLVKSCFLQTKSSYMVGRSEFEMM